MLKNSFYIIIVFFVSFCKLNSQTGSNAYQFLTLPNSARIAALGGNFLAIKDNDINLSVSNPSLITDKMNNSLSINYVNYFSDIKYGFAAYARSFEKTGTFVASLQFINYGTFIYTDATGEQLGSFKAGEYALNIGWARNLDSNFSIGSNLKLINSSFESYSSFGIATDVAVTYNNSPKKFTASLIFKNIGRQISYFTEGNRESLPFEIQFGLSKKIKHAPFRFSLLINHLEKWDISYEDPLNPTEKTDPLTGEIIKKSELSLFSDKLFRHFVLGAEFIPSENFNIRLGYNYQRRQEMKVESALSTVGFSWGFGLKISKFQLSYANVIQHLSGSSHLFTITTNLSQF